MWFSWYGSHQLTELHTYGRQWTIEFGGRWEIAVYAWAQWGSLLLRTHPNCQSSILNKFTLGFSAKTGKFAVVCHNNKKCLYNANHYWLQSYLHCKCSTKLSESTWHKSLHLVIKYTSNTNTPECTGWFLITCSKFNDHLPPLKSSHKVSMNIWSQSLC